MLHYTFAVYEGKDANNFVCDYLGENKETPYVYEAKDGTSIGGHRYFHTIVSETPVKLEGTRVYTGLVDNEMPELGIIEFKTLEQALRKAKGLV